MLKWSMLTTSDDGTLAWNSSWRSKLPVAGISTTKLTFDPFVCIFSSVILWLSKWSSFTVHSDHCKLFGVLQRENFQKKMAINFNWWFNQIQASLTQKPTQSDSPSCISKAEWCKWCWNCGRLRQNPMLYWTIRFEWTKIYEDTLDSMIQEGCRMSVLQWLKWMA